MKANYSNSVILNNNAVNNYVHYIKGRTSLMNRLNRFILIQLPYILEDLQIGRNDFMIGGSVALVAEYEIPIRKEFKDVDIIVKCGTIDRIKGRLMRSPFYKILDEFRSYMNEYCKENEHIEIRTLQGFAVDLIEVPEDKFNDMYNRSKMSYGGVFCPLIDILETKNKWGREKDLEDLALIEELFNNLDIRHINLNKESKDPMNAEDWEIELASNAPYGLGEVIEFEGIERCTSQKQIVKGKITAYDKENGVIVIFNYETQHEETYRVEPKIINFLA